MHLRLFFASLIGISIFSVGCTSDQQDKAREQAEKAKQELKEATDKTSQAAKEMAADARRKGTELSDRAAAEAARADEQLGSAAEKGKEISNQVGAGAAELALAAKVKAALANEAGLKTLARLSVRAEGTDVTLAGRAQTPADREKAGDIAAHVPGVGHVNNKIESGNSGKDR